MEAAIRTIQRGERMIIDEFSKYQIEWLTSHCDIEFNKEEEDLIIRFLVDTAEMYQRENECEDCISRKEALKYIHTEYDDDGEGQRVVYAEDIEELPSVTPQQKIGRWIESTGYDDRDHFYSCSECGRSINLICGAKLADYPYCHCGAKMFEPKENEE